MSKTFRKDYSHQNKPSKRITEHCEPQFVRHIQEKSNGHKVPKNGHSMINGIVRSKEKNSWKHQIDESFDEAYENYIYAIQCFENY